jgi:hypothetical protein
MSLLQPRTAVASLLLLVAAAMFSAGWQVTSDTRRFLSVAERTTGVVAGHEAYDREARVPRERFRLVVRFDTATGSRVRFRSVANYGRPPYAVGEEVPVLYDPDNPLDARVDRRVEVLAPFIIWGVAVTLVGALGLAVLVLGPRGGPARGLPRPRRG